MKTLTIIVNKGGKGSGDFGHKGIPGHQGGSAGGGVSSAKYGSRRDVALAITDGNIDLKSLNWQKQEKDRYASSGVDYWHADIGDGYSVTLTVTNGTSYGHIKNSRLRDERKTKHYVSASLSVHEQNVFSQFPVEKFSISKSVSGISDKLLYNCIGELSDNIYYITSISYQESKECSRHQCHTYLQ